MSVTEIKESVKVLTGTGRDHDLRVKLANNTISLDEIKELLRLERGL